MVIIMQWLPRNGVATPAQLITAVQDGFNMASVAARTATYTAHLLNGNLEYDLLSIGPRRQRQHGIRKRFFNDTVAGELRFHRIQQSISNNPEFELLGFRHGTAYGEAAFISAFFVDGRKTGAEAGQLDMVTAEGFFKDGRFPKDFHRPAAPVDGSSSAASIFRAHPTQPGRNVNGVNTFVVDTSLPSILFDNCGFYQGFVNQRVVPLYPNPTGIYALGCTCSSRLITIPRVAL
ncbi:hypothetical protein BKA70DRAFT_1459687 [Coprinopsis sp. MPI-PUGE-AT-0042]|nr:hypothetical protein BKA70DRAFT_1459687 [Coprinopsis sp. MPI-PUGE-AT-0042]